jgi:prepilin-type N-terminal cleavage/methylation domain-containing protein
MVGELTMNPIRLIQTRHRDDRGSTLVELIVVMAVFGIFITLFTASTTSMFGQLRRQQGTTDNLDVSRKVILLLDKQVRYANFIATPGTGTDGNTYVEWRTGNKGQQQQCTQWRYITTTNQLQYRTWLPPLSGVGTVAATSWVTEAAGISPKTGTPLWSITPTSANANREALTVTFVATHGKPAKSTTSQVSLTGLNTPSAAPTGATCTEVSRP